MTILDLIAAFIYLKKRDDLLTASGGLSTTEAKVLLDGFLANREEIPVAEVDWKTFKLATPPEL